MCLLRRPRRGELQALRCSAVDLGASTIQVERSWDQYEGAIDPKSQTSTRTVPLLAILRDYLDQHLLVTGRSGDELIFGRTPTDACVASTIRAWAKRAWETAELERITLHQCRHTFASLLIEVGTSGPMTPPQTTRDDRMRPRKPHGQAGLRLAEPWAT